jgi:hypothetical protein
MERIRDGGKGGGEGWHVFASVGGSVVGVKCSDSDDGGSGGLAAG